LPPRQATRRVCPASGDDLFEIEGVARWRFTTPVKQARGDRPVYLHCYRALGDYADGTDREAVVAKIEALP
jgi:hypothetical protein